MSDHKRDIRNFVINKPLQARIVYYFCAISLAIVGCQLVFMNNYIGQLRFILFNIPNVPISTQLLIDDRLSRLMTATLGFLLLSTVGAVIYGIIVSHRIAGPMFAILKYIEQLKTGDFKSERPLRPHDELEPIMNSLHELADTLKNNKK